LDAAADYPGSVSLFASTADFYRHHRSGVPAEIAVFLSENAPGGAPRRLLDVGTGPGFAIEALEPFFDEAIGIDLDAELLAAARDGVQTRKPVRFVQAAAETFALPPGWTAHLVTVCRAFHWFDRSRFLAHVVGHMAPGAALAILGDQSVWAGGDLWKDRVRMVVQEVLGEERRAGSGTYRPSDRRFTDDMSDAGFTSLTHRSVPVERVLTVDSVIGLLHSMSFASPAVLGERMDEFDRRVREELEPLVDDAGVLIDHNEFYVYTGARPD